jgi:plastocyanin
MKPGRILLALALAGLLSVPAQAATIQITISKLVFDQGTVEAKVGDTIEWINKDVIAHTATARDGDWNVMIGPNKTARLVLKKPGSVDYYCRFHPNMKGKLIISP